MSTRFETFGFLKSFNLLSGKIKELNFGNFPEKKKVEEVNERVPKKREA